MYRDEVAYLDASLCLLGSIDPLFEHLLVILRPITDRQLGDLDSVVVDLVDDTGALELVGQDALDGAL
jgi:hypothetical protein